MERHGRKPESLEQKLLKRIARKKGDVFLRGDFKDLGRYDVVGRALGKLVSKNELIKLGYGVYARAKLSPIDGVPIPVKGLETVKEAVSRLGIQTEPAFFQRLYLEGRSNQVPTGRVVGVRRRVRRKLGYGGVYLGFERVGSGTR